MGGTAPFHPNNHRVGDAGLDLAEFLNYYRFPPVYVTEEGEEKHETPMCPHVRGQVHYSMCREEALYVYGERWCEACRWHPRRVDFLEQGAADA